MEFIAAYWFIWLIAAFMSIVALFVGFFKSGGNPAFFVFAIFASASWVLFILSIILNLINFAASKFASAPMVDTVFMLT